MSYTCYIIINSSHVTVVDEPVKENGGYVSSLSI